MAFQKPKKQPQFADLKGILAQSKTKLDNATYQTIETLIDRLGQFQSLVVAQIDDIIAKAGITPINEPGNGNGNGGGTPDPHAETHAAGGTDPVQLTTGQVTGLDAALAGKASTSHAGTHRPGGTDPLALNAWLDTLNEFTAVNIFKGGATKQLEIQGNVHPALTMRNTSEVADSRVARMIYYQKNIRFDFTNDGEGVNVGHVMTMNRDTGLLATSGPIQGYGVNVLGNANQDMAGQFKLTSGYASPIAGKILFGDNTGWRLYMGPRVGSADYHRFIFNDQGDMSMTRHLDIGGSFTSVGDVAAGGRGSFSGNLIVQGTYLHKDGTMAMSLSNGTINFFTDQYDFINKANSGYLMRLNSAGNLTVSGRLGASGITSSHQENYIAAPQWVRLHFMDRSQLTGNQCFTIFNYGAVFRILPTTDDGGTPSYQGDWASSLNILRDGHVQIGPAGLEVRRVINGSGLASAEWTPVPIDIQQGGSGTPVWHTARWMRVGNVWTMSGQVDVTANGGGQTLWVRAYTPSYILYSLVNGATGGTGCFTNGLNGGYVNCSPSSGHFDMIITVTNGGNQGFFYTVTWVAGT